MGVAHGLISGLLEKMKLIVSTAKTVQIFRQFTQITCSDFRNSTLLVVKERVWGKGLSGGLKGSSGTRVDSLMLERAGEIGLSENVRRLCSIITSRS